MPAQAPKILAFDPAKTPRNNCYVVATAHELIAYGCSITVDSFGTSYQQRVRSADLAIRKLLDRHRPDLLLIERYLSRGSAQVGGGSEYINILQGIYASAAAEQSIAVEAIMPATHKNFRNKVLGKGIDYRHTQIGTGLNVHIADALSLCAWAFGHTFNLTLGKQWTCNKGEER